MAVDRITRRWHRVLLLAMLAGVLLPTTARAAPFGFAPPVLVDRQLAGGEPTAAYAVKSGLLIYTAHEGTTHLYSSNLPGAPAESGAWLGDYRNQVNIWWSANKGRTWTRVDYLAGFFNNPLINTGFSDPDLTQDAAGNIYDTGINLANDALFSSHDGGKSWPTGTPQCHNGDRPWIAGGGKNEAFLSTDTNEAGHEIFHSTDAGASCSSAAIPDTGKTRDGGMYLGQGKILYDQRRGSLIEGVYYQNTAGHPEGVGIGILPNASHAFSNPNAKFIDVHIAKTTAFSHWPSIAIDSAGNYYIVWDTDARSAKSRNGCPGYYSGSESSPSASNAPTPLSNRVLMSVSTDGGRKWSKPRTVAYFPGHRLLWPWITAGSAGNVGLVFYRYDRVTDPDCGKGKVYVLASLIRQANTAHPHESTVAAWKHPIHAGAICAGGTACAVTVGVTGEDRRLGDYFTDATDSQGCLIIATGYTGLTDPITKMGSPISHPLFLRQDSGTGLYGVPCS